MPLISSMVELQLIEGHWQFVIYEPFKHGQHKVRFSDVGRVFFLIKVLDRNARGAAMLETIKNAIKNRQYISLTYDQKPRVVQPTAVGETSAGKKLLIGYQTEGEHKNTGHDWISCDLTKISDLQVCKDKFFLENPPNYQKGHKSLKKIFVEL